MLFYVFAYKNTNKHRIPLTFPEEKTKNERKTIDFEQKKQSRPRDSFESPSREYLVFIFRGLYFQFRPSGVQDDIQDKVEHNPYHDVNTQDIRDVHIPYQRHVDQDKHQ